MPVEKNILDNECMKKIDGIGKLNINIQFMYCMYKLFDYIPSSGYSILTLDCHIGKPFRA